MLRKRSHSILLFSITILSFYEATRAIAEHPTESRATTNEARTLTATEAAKFLPGAVFFRGQSATIQARNSGGVQFNKDALLLVTLVDTTGYSSSVQEKYQAYLITEAPIDIDGHRLPPGAYGCGFVAGNTFIVMDIGGHDLLSAHSSRDATLHRPTPLQVLPAPDGTGYRIYAGRDYINFTQSQSQTSNTPALHP